MLIFGISYLTQSTLMRGNGFLFYSNSTTKPHCHTIWYVVYNCYAWLYYIYILNKTIDFSYIINHSTVEIQRLFLPSWTLCSSMSVLWWLIHILMEFVAPVWTERKTIICDIFDTRLVKDCSNAEIKTNRLLRNIKCHVFGNLHNAVVGSKTHFAQHFWLQPSSSFRGPNPIRHF